MRNGVGRGIRKGTVLRAALALALVAGIATTVAPAATAGGTGRYRTTPAGTPQKLIDLGLAVTVAAGTTRLISSTLVLGSAGELTFVAHQVFCYLPRSSTVVQDLHTGQNVARASTVTLLARGLVTAPASGPLTCRVYAVFVNHTSTRAYGTITVLRVTLQGLTASIRSWAQTWQTTKPLVNTSYRAAPVSFTPPANARSIQAIGDVNVTVCYASDTTGLCAGPGARRARTFGYVGTQLTVQQLQSNGRVCRSFASGPLVGTVVTSTIHHRKSNSAIANIPVTSSCTSRRFIAYTRVTANHAANSFLIDPHHATVTLLYVRP